MRAKAGNALVFAALILAGRAGAQVEPVRISDMADDLQRIQFRMAQGDKSAYPAQLKQLKAMGAAIASAKPETWQGRREADALVIYLLSGGALAGVIALLKSDALLESDRTLAPARWPI